MVERGLAREWNLRVGDELGVGDPKPVAPARSTSARCGSSASRSRPTTSPTRWRARRASTSPSSNTATRSGSTAGIRPNIALLWLNDPSKADVTLTQARAVAFGLGKLQFITRTGVQILLSQAAGIVISLLVAFSLVALVAAGTMLAAGAHAEVQRRLTGFGVQRALGFGAGRIAAQQAGGGRAWWPCPRRRSASPSARWWWRGRRPICSRRSTRSARAWRLLGPLLVALAAVVLVVVSAATWPAWRAARRPPVEILRGGDLARTTARGGSGAAASSPSACASPPPRAAAGWPPWPRSPSAPAWSR